MKYLAFIIFSLFYSAITFSEVDAVVQANIKQGLIALFDDVNVTDIQSAPVDGLYQVNIGAHLVYAYGDGSFVLTGDLYDAKARRNISEETRTAMRYKLLQQIPEKDIIEFAPEQPKYSVYVFTDTDCGYCRKLHQDMPELNRKGIAVRYLAFPRGDMESPTAEDMQSIWCAVDKQRAMTAVKNNLKPEKKSCHNPVEQQYELGIKMGVRGTPAMYTETGRELKGYMPPDELLEQLNKRNNS